MATLALSYSLLSCFFFFIKLHLLLITCLPLLLHAHTAPRTLSLLSALAADNTSSTPSSTSTFNESALSLLEFKRSIAHDPLQALSTWALNSTNTSQAQTQYPFAYCQWKGIGCDNLSQVVSLTLPDLQLEGSISPALGSLPFLIILNLSSNLLSGGIPPELGRLQSLLYLNLAQNRLTGTIPMQLGNISSLTFLVLDHNNLTGSIPASLASCTELYYLNLRSNQLSGLIPPELGALTNLNVLVLSLNMLYGIIPSQIFLLPNLASLDLSDNFLLGSISQLLPNYDSNACQSLQIISLARNNISGILPASVGQCKNLVYLLLQNNQINGTLPDELGVLPLISTIDLSSNHLYGPIPKTLQNATTLEFLKLDANYALSGPLPAQLCRTPTLQYLYLDYNSLSGDLSSLANCSSLINLYVSVNVFEGVIPWEFGSFTDLQQIVLASNQLTGQIPPTLGNCSNLIVLGLNDNHLTGAIPSELGKLKNLRFLTLHNNNLSFTIPSTLGNCSSLSNLYLDQNKLEGHIPSEFGKLRLLADVRLFMNSLTGPIPASIFNCSSLVYLAIQVNHLTGPLLPDIKALKSLEYLSINDNELTGSIPHEISECLSLQFLYLLMNNFTGSIPHSIGSLVLLQELDLSRNTLSGPLPLGMASLENLTWLALSYNKLNGSIDALQIGKALSKLKLLFLQHNQLTGNIPEAIGNCRNLTRLRLHDNRLTGTIPPTFGELKFLTELFLSENQLTGSIPVALGDCLALISLTVAYNKLNGSLPSSIGKLVGLATELNVSHNELSGDIPPQLGALQLLVSMDLSQNNFSGSIPADLGSCVMLQIMNLSSNALTGAIPDTLGSLLSLKSLNLSYNFLQGSIPASLSKLPDLTYFSVAHNELVGSIPDSLNFQKLPPDSFLGNPGLCGQIVQKPCPKDGRNSIIAWPLVVGIVIAILVIVAVMCYAVKQYKRAGRHADGNIDMIELTHFMRLSEEEIKVATDAFSSENILGRGGFSTVYKARLQQREGQVLVAVKVLKAEQAEPLSNSKIDKIFIAELNTLGKLRHRNLVRILGYCSNLDMKAIILEYIPNGSLEDWLYGASRQSLSWEQRVNIGIGIAQGLVYLHHEYDQDKCVVHCDLKPSNIRLDEELQPRIADFAIARILSNDGHATSDMIAMLQGSVGYMAPEYGAWVKPSAKVDVYSYGVILLDLIIKKKPTSGEFGEGMSMRKWMHEQVDVGNLESIEDPALFGSLQGAALRSNEICMEILEALLQLGLKCTSESAMDQPTMKEALAWAHQHTQKEDSYHLVHYM